MTTYFCLKIKTESRIVVKIAILIVINQFYLISRDHIAHTVLHRKCDKHSELLEHTLHQCSSLNIHFHQTTLFSLSTLAWMYLLEAFRQTWHFCIILNKLPNQRIKTGHESDGFLSLTLSKRNVQTAALFKIIHSGGKYSR